MVLPENGGNAQLCCRSTTPAEQMMVVDVWVTFVSLITCVMTRAPVTSPMWLCAWSTRDGHLDILYCGLIQRYTKMGSIIWSFLS